MKIWLLPFFIGLISIISGNLTFIISSNQGFIESCIPYIAGCTSISASGRQGLAFIIFKLTMLPIMTTLLIYWVISFQLLSRLTVLKHSKALKIMLIAGVVGSLFGILYTAFLGSNSDLYQLLRRFGIYFFFLGTFLAQICESIFIKNLIHSKIASFMGYVVLVIGLVILFSTPFYSFIQEDAWLENVLEWNITFLIFLYFIISGLNWKKIQLSINVETPYLETGRP